jgi:hypothetical protein
MKSRTQRKLFILVVLAGITIAGFLTYRALQENLLYAGRGGRSASENVSIGRNGGRG